MNVTNIAAFNARNASKEEAVSEEHRICSFCQGTGFDLMNMFICLCCGGTGRIK